MYIQLDVPLFSTVRSNRTMMLVTFYHNAPIWENEPSKCTEHCHVPDQSLASMLVRELSKLHNQMQVPENLPPSAFDGVSSVVFNPIILLILKNEEMKQHLSDL